FFFSSRRRHTRFSRDWSSDVCSSDLFEAADAFEDDEVATVAGLLEMRQPADAADPLQRGAAARTLLCGVLRLDEPDQPVAGKGRSEERRVGKGGRARGWGEAARDIRG